MLNLRAISCVVAAVVFSSFITGSALAQEKKQAEQVSIDGKILGIVPGYLQVETDGGEVWVVHLPRDLRNTSLVGRAELSWLKPGMWVYFLANFNGKGEPAGPVKQITVFTPVAGGGRWARGNKENDAYKPGVVADSQLGKDFSFTGENQPKTPADQVITYRVTGVVRGLRNGALSVQAANIPVQAPVDDKTNVSVDVSDIRGAQVGDKATIRAAKVAPGKAVANSVKILAAKPFGEAEKPDPKAKPEKEPLPEFGKPAAGESE